METVEVRTIDELGRIAIPTEIRKEKGWEIGTKITICAYDDAVVLEESKCGQQQED
ncbi:MAG: AbrB/MazE/SpoVT family DNA-binding domain-containing protein [Defluviitaleaceae bacterium]|nr:AbrB/MazE/SpoVT family DNA-binding domain-containing protein [Defluviitaleaceae bacterium]